MGVVSLAQKEEIRSRIPLEEILREYNVHLIPSGRGFKALCPFHQEKTPSFYVDPEKQLYYCYGCHEGGDLFRFVQLMDRVDFPEAVEILARRAGIVLETSPGGGRTRDSTLALYDALEAAREYYHRILLEDPRAEAARRYLRERGIEEPQWKKFRLGYSLPDWDALLRRLSGGGASGNVSAGSGAGRFAPAVLERAGLLRKRREGSSYYDYFRGRLMFPIDDVRGRTIGFGARTLADEEPKYLNSPSTPIFDKSQVLYGISQAKNGIRREGRLAIVEGYTDVIMAHQAGLDFVVAGLGTAFTAQNARTLRRLTEKVYVVFDGDAAGQSAGERSLDLLVGEDLDVWICPLTGGMDPCDAIRAEGGEAFRRKLDEEALGIFEYKWMRTVGTLPPGASAAARSRAMDTFLDLVAKVRNPVTRRLVLRDFLERMGLEERDVEARLERKAGRAEGAGRVSAARAPAGTNPAGKTERPHAALLALREAVLTALFSVPERAGELWSRVPDEVFSGAAGRNLREAIERQLAENTFSGSRLAVEVEEPEAKRAVIEVLSRLEAENEMLAEERELLWNHCVRDLERWALRRKVAELERLKARARAEGDTERYRRYRGEFMRLQRRLKGSGTQADRR